MPQIKNLELETLPNILNDEEIAYENLAIQRRKAAILSSDTEKFKLFTKLMRISRMMKNAKISNQNDKD